VTQVKTISIRELHAKTGRWVRAAGRYGQILVTDNGKTVAKLLPERVAEQTPYFGRRNYLNADLRKSIETGQLGKGGTDSTDGISEDRANRE
jgi:antitoxin (DNA-binding transcriptional repressor) of toxin-antitoxin stability system